MGVNGLIYRTEIALKPPTSPQPIFSVSFNLNQFGGARFVTGPDGLEEQFPGTINHHFKSTWSQGARIDGIGIAR